jgi:Papain family cysteine protease
MAALQNGPAAAAVDASSNMFTFYKSGVITDAATCGTDLDHAVAIFGYGT